jgi:dTDP-4-amino-4,6-dideoxygalactose transaminase
VSNPFDIVRQFEQDLCDYTGAPYAVATTSCTMALLMALQVEDLISRTINIPKLTYVGVPMAIQNAGCEVTFRDEDWQGYYRLCPTGIYDSARLLTSGMYLGGSMMCLSFHWTKHLAIGQGGAILLDDHERAALLRRMRFDGRTEGVDAKADRFLWPSFHAYMMPRDAAEGITRLALLPRHNDPLPRSAYPDLSLQECFK